MGPHLEYAVSSSGELRATNSQPNCDSIHSVTTFGRTAEGVSLSRIAIMKAYPGKYMTEIQERHLYMKIFEPKRYEVDPAITTHHI